MAFVLADGREVAMSEDLKGRELRISERMKAIRTAGLFGLDWGDPIFHQWGSGLIILPTVFSYFRPDWEPYLFKAAIVGLGMLLTTLVGRVSVAAWEVQRLNFLIWDILTDKDEDVEGLALKEYTRARLRKIFGLSPDD
jgi:hypothetical protein